MQLQNHVMPALQIYNECVMLVCTQGDFRYDFPEIMSEQLNSEVTSNSSSLLKAILVTTSIVTNQTVNDQGASWVMWASCFNQENMTRLPVVQHQIWLFSLSSVWHCYREYREFNFQDSEAYFLSAWCISLSLTHVTRGRLCRLG